MPTARELLEQADALMRRNRSPMLDDIPVLTDSVGAIPPPRIARSRPALREPEPEPEVPASQPSTIPTLTESVTARAEPQPATPSPPAPQVAVVEEGEPSDWLQLGEGEPSVIGEAVDSIAVVPEVEEPSPPVEEPVSEEIQVTASGEEAEVAFEDEIEARLPPPTHPVEPPASASELAAAFKSTEAPTPDLAFIDDPTLSPMHALDDDVPTVIGVEKQIDLRVPEPIEDALLGVPLEATTALAASAAAERARWDAAAEEIRMQVLQRLDLFTDTALREQLGVRLQPIVDRASADLVAAINQHVGELLRAYVAEALEREIENWRQNQ